VAGVRVVVVGVFAGFGGVVVAVVAVDYLRGDIVVEEAGEDLDSDEAEDEEDEEEPGGFGGRHVGFF
jgi:sensor domain CHASE-containing protein